MRRVRFRFSIGPNFAFVFMLLVPISGTAAAQQSGGQEDAVRWFKENTLFQCRTYEETVALFAGDGVETPRRHVLDTTDEFGAVKQGEDPTVIYEFFCDGGAYNTYHIYVVYRDERFKQLAFSQPVVSVKYIDEDNDTDVKSIDIVGFETRANAANPKFDAKTRMLHETGYWRGIGDASNESWWQFMGDRFVLKRYRVDASYDGEVNPQFDESWPAK